MVRKSLKGGNANVFPSEYYGINSGNYHDNVFPNPGNSAYGSYVPQSLGQSLSNSFFGTNMGVYPNSSVVQTGGYCDYNKRSYNNRSKKSNGNGKSKKKSKSKSKSKAKAKSKAKSKAKDKSKAKAKK